LAKSSKESSTRVLDCANILAKQVSVKSTFWDRLIGDNLVVASAFAVTEMAGAKRLQSTDGQQVIAADMLGTNIYSATSALVGSYLVNTQKSLPISLITRAGMGLGMIEVQRGIYQVTLDKNPEDRANAIAAFDQAYLFARLPVAHYTDKFIMKQLPELLFDSCKKGGKLSVIITPRSVRIMERYGMAILYFGLRSAIIGE